jgi:hypothetical protein
MGERVMFGKTYFLLHMLLISASSLCASSWYYSDRSLIVGDGEPGFVDGSQEKARLNKPMGLAVTDDGKTLYVCDSGNHAIRVVSLEKNFSVATLVGNGKPGFMDGIGTAASFSKPAQMSLSQDNATLLVMDSENGAIRKIDVKTRVVSTLFKTVQPGYIESFCWNWKTNSGYVLNRGRQEIFSLDALGNTAACIQGGDLKGELLLWADRPMFCLASGELSWIDPEKKAMVFSVTLTAKPDSLGNGPDGNQSFWDEATGRIIMANPQTKGIAVFESNDILGRSLTLTAEGLPNARTAILGKVYGCWDPYTRHYYLSDSDSNRILAQKYGFSCQNLSYGQNPMGCPSQHKYWGVKRVYVVGSSMPVTLTNMGIKYSITMAKNMERFFNLDQLFKEKPVQIEVVIHSQDAGRYGGSSLSWLAQQNLDVVNKYEVDDVLILINTFEMLWETMGPFRAASIDGLPAPIAEMSFGLMDEKEKMEQLSAPAEKLRKYLFLNKDRFSMSLKYAPDSKWPSLAFNQNNQELLEDPEFMRFLEAAVIRALDKMATLAAAKRVSIILVPTRNHLSTSEMPGGGNSGRTILEDKVSGFMAQACRSRNIRYGSVIDETRRIEPAFFPLFPADNMHFDHIGHQSVGYLCAKKFAELTKQ